MAVIGLHISKAKALPYLLSGGNQHTGGRPIGRFYTAKDRKTELGKEGSKTADGFTRIYETDTDSAGKLTLYYEPSLFGGTEK